MNASSTAVVRLRVSGDIQTAFSVEIEAPGDLDQDSDSFAELVAKAIGGRLRLGREHALTFSDIVELDEDGNEVAPPTTDEQASQPEWDIDWTFGGTTRVRAASESDAHDSFMTLNHERLLKTASNDGLDVIGIHKTRDR